MQFEYIKNATTLEYDVSKCTGCTLCTIVCPHHVFKMDSGKAVLQNKALCMECGACMKNCKVGAIQVRAGVGCACAVIQGKIKGTEPTCGCSDEKTGCC